MDFDKHANTYRDEVQSSLVAGADSDLVLEVKADLFLDLLKRNQKQEVSVLDVGCGTGLMDRYWKNRVKRLSGIDVSQVSLAEAAKTNPWCEYKHYDGKNFPYPDNSFDSVVTICVLHHIPPLQWPDFFREVRRVLKPGGLFAVFDHNPFNPLTRLVVSRCEFDKDAILLSQYEVARLAKGAGLTHFDTKSILYFPWRAKIFRWIEKPLGYIPMGGQYYAAFTK